MLMTETMNSRSSTPIARSFQSYLNELRPLVEFPSGDFIQDALLFTALAYLALEKAEEAGGDLSLGRSRKLGKDRLEQAFHEILVWLRQHKPFEDAGRRRAILLTRLGTVVRFSQYDSPLYDYLPKTFKPRKRRFRRK